jgi:hypothetical protein
MDETPYWVIKDYEYEKPTLQRLLETISFSDWFEQSENEKVYYARLSDLSWWNLPGNARLLPALTVKGVSMGTGVAFERHRYDVTAPHVHGFLTRDDRKTSDLFEFAFEDREFSISIIARGEPDYSMEDIIATIGPIEDVDKAYNEMEALYKNNPGYPEELLILAMISLKGPQENYQREYLIKELGEWLERYEEDYKNPEDEEDRDWAGQQIEEMKADIEYFQSQMEKSP